MRWFPRLIADKSGCQCKKFEAIAQVFCDFLWVCRGPLDRFLELTFRFERLKFYMKIGISPSAGHIGAYRGKIGLSCTEMA